MLKHLSKYKFTIFSSKIYNHLFICRCVFYNNTLKKVLHEKTKMNMAACKVIFIVLSIQIFVVNSVKSKYTINLTIKILNIQIFQ